MCTCGSYQAHAYWSLRSSIGHSEMRNSHMRWATTAHRTARTFTKLDSWLTPFTGGRYAARAAVQVGGFRHQAAESRAIV